MCIRDSARVVRAKVDRESSLPSLFEPQLEFLKDNKLQMVDAVVEPDGQKQVTLIIENQSRQPLKLKKNQVVGHLVPAQPIELTEEVGPS